jgi:hypothetical protein
MILGVSPSTRILAELLDLEEHFACQIRDTLRVFMLNLFGNGDDVAACTAFVPSQEHARSFSLELLNLCLGNI